MGTEAPEVKFQLSPLYFFIYSTISYFPLSYFVLIFSVLPLVVLSLEKRKGEGKERKLGGRSWVVRSDFLLSVKLYASFFFYFVLISCRRGDDGKSGRGLDGEGGRCSFRLLVVL